MPARVGILKVSMDNGICSARAEGQLTVMEWLFALEMTKQRVLAGQQKTNVVDLFPRKVDGGAEVQ